jgi:hypothetical protein
MYKHHTTLHHTTQCMFTCLSSTSTSSSASLMGVAVVATVVLCFTLHYTTLHYTTLHYTTLHYTALHGHCVHTIIHTYDVWCFCYFRKLSRVSSFLLCCKTSHCLAPPSLHLPLSSLSLPTNPPHSPSPSLLPLPCLTLVLLSRLSARIRR